LRSLPDIGNSTDLAHIIEVHYPLRHLNKQLATTGFKGLLALALGGERGDTSIVYV